MAIGAPAVPVLWTRMAAMGVPYRAAVMHMAMMRLAARMIPAVGFEIIALGNVAAVMRAINGACMGMGRRAPLVLLGVVNCRANHGNPRHSSKRDCQITVSCLRRGG